MSVTQVHVVMQPEGILIPRELFGRNEIVLAELKDAGVLSEPANSKVASIVREAAPIDLTREWRWLEEHGQEYVNQWVALDGDRLLSHGNNAREVAEAARAMGVASPFVTQVDPPEELPFGGW